MTTQQVMLVLYPVTAALCGAYATLSFVFWYTTRRTYVSFFNALFFLVEFVVLALLTLTTGNNPTFNIDDYRLLVVLARIVRIVVIILCIIFTTRMIYRQGTHTKSKCQE